MLMLFAAIGVGLWIISRGIIIEPPAVADRSRQQIERAHCAAARTAGRSMSMMTNTLARYFGRFLTAVVGVFVGIFVLLVLVDYIEMMRRTSGLVSASASWSPRPRCSACRNCSKSSCRSAC